MIAAGARISGKGRDLLAPACPQQGYGAVLFWGAAPGILMYENISLTENKNAAAILGAYAVA